MLSPMEPLSSRLISALANDQKLSKTNVRRVVVVDNVNSDVRGIIYRGDASPGKLNISLMGPSSPAKGRSSLGEVSETQEETSCFCCKKKKRDQDALPPSKQPLLDGLTENKA